MGSISSLSSSLLHTVLNTVLQGTGLTTGNTLNTGGSSPLGLPADSSQLSPFAQLMSTLQQLQQSDPTKYQQVTGQIATNLQSAAQAAEAQGNTAAANLLNQFATDFTNASKTGQVPNIQDLAQAAGAHGPHHHHHSHSGANPMNIILNTLSNAGIGTTTS